MSALDEPKPRVTVDVTQLLADVPSRIARIEAHVEHMSGDIGELKGDVKGLRTEARTDFRLLFGALIAVALGLAGLIAHGFHWIG